MMELNYEYFVSLDRGTQHLVEWQYHFSGDFNRALFEVIGRADEINLYRLARGFPEEVEAYKNYTRVNGWWQKIQKGLFPKEE